MNNKNFEEQFNHPSNEFRGAPFWAWNGELETAELYRQMECFKEMGFGGFFMHSRAGQATEYLGDKFMSSVHTCVDFARRNNLKAYLYDEDRWPSGFAGGYVTREKKYRQRRLVLSKCEITQLNYNASDCEPKLLQSYDIIFDKNGRMTCYSAGLEKSEGERWYAYEIIAPVKGWFNGYTYADTLQAEAVDKFIEITHVAYKNKVGQEFGKTVPAIFTDEPNYGKFDFKAFSNDGKDIEYPWTSNLPQIYENTYSENILERLPEIFWQTAETQFSSVRYRYFKLLSELFARSYCDRIGEWCDKNGIDFVGHLLNEPRLLSQTSSVGETMRMYKTFTIPGIDILCNAREFTTAKQAQSVARQYGRKGILSEMYGVTGWDFDFRGHKFQGDWQAALGVVFRVPHLSWMYMKGSAKRDFPASIGLQSAWYKEYKYIEDHFARVNVAMTSGKPIVRVAVLHPIESVWCSAGALDQSETATALDAQFTELTEWLLRGQIDFDFISESLLSEQRKNSNEYFIVGEMSYETVFIPPIISVRSSTLKALKAFLDKGGKVITCGNAPVIVDGIMSDKAKGIWNRTTSVLFNQSDILKALKSVRDIMIFGKSGLRKSDMIYQLREDQSGRWLFIAHCDPKSRYNGADCACDDLKIEIKGKYSVTLYNTLTGKTEEVTQQIQGKKTYVFVKSYPLDSFLFRLNATVKQQKKAELSENEKTYSIVQIPDEVDFELSEQNVLVLDQCEWALDGEAYNECEEILRIDEKIREKFNYPLADGSDIQPWCFGSAEPKVFVRLKFTFESSIESACEFACEQLNEIIFNGQKLRIEDIGFFVDKSIRKIRVPNLRKGDNQIEIKVPISERISLENCFILGNFGVKIRGKRAAICKKPKKIPFGSITDYGFPFYGGAITYKIPFETTAKNIAVTADHYCGALISAAVDDCEVGKIVIPPYKLFIESLQSGKHLLNLTLYASRINVFGALHLDTDVYWKDASMWYAKGNKWAYEYRVQPIGIMKSPVLEVENSI